jgi:magnesium transporter
VHDAATEQARASRTRSMSASAHAVHGAHAARSTFELSELDVVLGKHFVLTHHSKPMPGLDTLREDVARNGRPLNKGAAWVAHAVLDHVVDDYIPILDRLDVQLDDLEDEVLTDPTQDVLGRIFQSKRELQQLRRAFVHQKELFHRLGRGDFPLIPEALVPFFRDVYDHFARVADLAESYRDLVGAALDTYLSVQSNKMNAIMKQLTLTATIFMPLSFIAGFYGMNFEFMPELHRKWGYPAVIGVMVMVAFGMLAFYRRKKWI